MDEKILAWIPIIISGIATLVQVSPIKINPWSALLKWVGNQINGELHKELSDIKEDVETLKREADEKEARRLRADIFDFANSCRNNRKHTKDEFENIFRDYDDYMKIIHSREIKNGFLEAECEYIRSIFRECQQKNSFL